MNEPDDHFGLCPVCHDSDGYLNVGRDHWFFCDKDLTRWCPWSNLLSSWQHEDEATWGENIARLHRHRVVKPWYRGLRPQLAIVRNEGAP